MPELPEVETSRRGVAPYVEGQQITELIVRDKRLRWPVPDELTENLPGQTVRQLRRRAKYLLFECDHGVLMLHLGMSGRLHVLDNNRPAQKHDHVDIVFANGYRLRFTDPRRFGALLWTRDVDRHALISHLGPEPLSADFDAQYLYTQTRGRKVSIKTLIMNARVVVGVGNIYASEACFLAGIHPAMAAARLSRPRAAKLVDAIQTVLQNAIAAGGTTLRDFRDSDGKPGYFKQKLMVYARHAEPCRICATPVEKIVQTQRASYFCPRCQRR